MSKTSPDFFSGVAALSYDDRNKELSRISECLHFLVALILKDLPTRSRILCVGAGTGAEILSLAQIFPEWEFLALDPSQAMLNVCHERLKGAGLANRCELVCGYVQDLPNQTNFDAALSILVAHFVERDQRIDFFRNMCERLRKDGYLVNSEISFDLNSIEFPSMLQSWGEIQSLMGATAESLANLPMLLRDVLTVLPPAETETTLRLAGINCPIRFFQAFMICGWFGKKED